LTEEINTLAKHLTVSDGTSHKIIVGNLGMGCSDCGVYAEDFAVAFRSAGWAVEQVNYADLNPAIKGVFVVAHDQDQPPRDALTVKNALDQTGIPNGGIKTWDYVKGDDLELIVMPKP
jgi:hypothetical protein